jgi:cysteine desulfurase / selenocysteine lyase
MPTPTPIDSPDGFAAAFGAADEGTLAQLANEFFRLPNGGSSPNLTAPPVPSAPSAPSPAGTTIPATPNVGHGAPSSLTPTGIPDNVQQSVPGVAFGVPEAYAPGLPQVEPSPAPTSNAPYYFLAEANAYLTPTPPAVPAPGDRVTAQPGSLPGGHELSRLLGSISLGITHDVVPASPPGNNDARHQFYFIDPAGTHTGHVPNVAQTHQPPYDVHAVRRDFPILHQKVNGKPLIWLDSAATSQKPQAVIDAESYFYEHDNSNIHRAAHALAARATDAYEGARKKVQHFLGAALPEEIIFVRGATEGVNLIAQTCGRQRIQAGDEIILTTLEHHANIVPWQFLTKEKGATLKVVPITDRGEVVLDEYARLLSPRTRIVALGHVSNTLGTVVPVELMTRMARQVGATVVIDGSQSAPHFRINVRAIDCDFFVFSGHKLFAPTGIGVVYGKKAHLDAMPPWQGGGNMIQHVTFEHTTFNETPYKFEAGTGNIAGAVGLGAAIDYLNKIGFEAATQYEDGLLAYGTERLAAIPGLRLYGTAPHKVGVLSFNLDGIKPEEVGKFLDREGIAVRAGHHCAQPTMQRYGVTGMVRPSLAFYNTYDEMDALAVAVYKAKKALS